MVKSIFRNRNILALLVIFILGILSSRTLIFQEGYFNMHDDLQMMRQLQLEKCFIDGQIPCRWVPDMGYGFGFPLFNFYPPLPYLIGQLFRAVGFSFVMTAKLTFAVALIASGFSMYYFSREFLGKKGGLLASIFYLWAPYHAVDVYVRGAMNESWALVWFPLILWTSYRLIKDPIRKGVFSKKQKLNFRSFTDLIRPGMLTNKWLIGLALSYAALLLTHNLMVLIFTPVMAVWILIHLVSTRDFPKLLPLATAGIWAIGLAAFFTVPAALENRFTQIRGQLIGYYDFTAHFVSIRQILIDRFWGYGPSVWGTADDGMSFQVGHMHWVLSLAVGVALVYLAVKAYKSSSKNPIKLINLMTGKYLLVTLGLFFLIVGWLSIFMLHPRSIFIWNIFPQLGLVQFPWRFLALVIFCLSFVVGMIPKLIDDWDTDKNIIVRAVARVNNVFWVALLIIALVSFNWSYFLPEHGRMGRLTDSQKFSGAAWDLQQTAGIYDYLPATAVMAPQSPMTELGEVMLGEAQVFNERQGTYWLEFTAEVESEEAVIRLGTFDFPGWQVKVNNNPIEHYIAEDEQWGRIYIDLAQGTNAVRAEFVDTPVRNASNYISILSWILLAGALVARGGQSNKER